MELVDREKPAHTAYRVCLADADMRVGMNARVGVDSIVGGAPETLRLDTADGSLDGTAARAPHGARRPGSAPSPSADCGSHDRSPAAPDPGTPRLRAHHTSTGKDETVADQTISEATLRGLAAPERNRYFYGKLLDDRHLTMEQCYALGKRWMLNRLTLGTGVLCGLRVIACADGSIAVTAGVAIDGVGREIVVPAAAVVDPAQPTDGCGLPVGERLTTGQTTISLCYTECGAEPVRVLAGDCDTTAAFADSTVVERFRITVGSGLPVAGARPGGRPTRGDLPQRPARRVLAPDRHRAGARRRTDRRPAVPGAGLDLRRPRHRHSRRRRDPDGDRRVHLPRPRCSATPFSSN